MNLHEYQAKSLLRQFGVPTLDGFVAYTPREAEKRARDLGAGLCVLKAQVHAGGRGKAGGVKLASSPSEARALAQELLGMRLVSKQTGPEGVLVRKVLVEAAARISREYYLSMLIDRSVSAMALIVSGEGGMEIEELAANSPEKILKVIIAPEVGLSPFHCRKVSAFLGLTKPESSALEDLLEGLYAAFLGLDCSLLEINPLVLTEEGAFICLDAKLSIDDNALFRQEEAQLCLDYDELDERETRAAEVGLSYVSLGGNIGCMVNGAGLAMATADIIQESGGEPANFLDVGGGASRQMVCEAFKLILEDKAVAGILVNIFGGIMRCDVIAEGIIEAARELQVSVPLVVRLQGTNVERGRELLSASGLAITIAEEMDEAARLIVAAVGH